MTHRPCTCRDTEGAAVEQRRSRYDSVSPRRQTRASLIYAACSSQGCRRAFVWPRASGRSPGCISTRPSLSHFPERSRRSSSPRSFLSRFRDDPFRLLNLPERLATCVLKLETNETAAARDIRSYCIDLCVTFIVQSKDEFYYEAWQNSTSLSLSLSSVLQIPAAGGFLQRLKQGRASGVKRTGAIVLRALCYMYKNLYYVTKDTVNLAEYGNIIAMRNYVQFVINR